MAYTKAPVNDTHNVQRIPFRGTPIVVSDTSTTNATVNTLSYIDCFPRTEKQWGIDPVRRVHKREGWQAIDAGLVTTAQITFGRSVVFCEGSGYQDTAYFPINNEIWKIQNMTTATPSMAVEVTGVTYGNTAWGTLAIDNTGDNRVCFLTSNHYLHTFKEDGTGNTTTNLGSAGSPAIYVDSSLVFLNGYLFAVASGTGRIYNSAAGGDVTTWSTTDYLTPEIYPDFCVHIEKHKNHLVAFSRNSIEFFYDGGIEVGSPLARQEAYASNVGLYPPNSTSSSSGKMSCRIGDDIYFVGRTAADSPSLFRIRNFQVEELDNQYIAGVLAYSNTDYVIYQGIQTLIINNNPMVSISIDDGYEIVYFPEEDTWWNIRTDTDTDRGLPSVNTDFPGYEKRICGGYSPIISSGSRRPCWALSFKQSDGHVYVHVPAYSSFPTVQADLYTEVIDFGINYYKHLARVDLIGDFNSNTLTLSYNGTPNYSQTYTACAPVHTSSTNGYGNNVSWYNLGAFRRFSFKVTLSGTSEAFLNGLDIEYNAGAA